MRLVCPQVRRHFFWWMKRFLATNGHVAQRLRIGEAKVLQMEELGHKAFVCFSVRRFFHRWLRLSQALRNNALGN
jgi:hypothetical protein